MATKYFCDICEKQTKRENLQPVYLTELGGDRLDTTETCPSCYAWLVGRVKDLFHPPRDERPEA